MKMKSIGRNKRIWISPAFFVLFFLASYPRPTVAQTNTFPNDGNVGIGTMSPNSKLHVVGNLLVDGIVTSNSEPAYGAGSQVRSWGINKPDSNMYIEWGDTASSTLFITDHWRYTSPVAIMAGNVGIGTLAPYYKLDIQGSASRNTLGITGDGDAVGYAGITINALTTTNISEYRTSQFKLHMRKDSWYGGDGSGPSFIIESTSKIGGYAAPFMITPTNDVILNGGQGAYGLSYGNVGIGTTGPQAKLHIEGPGGGTPELLRINNGYFNLKDRGDLYGAQFRMTAGNSVWDIYNQRSNGAFHIYQLTDAASGGVYADRLIIDQTGRVGIGTASPSYQLDVAGQIRSSSGGFRFPDGSVQTTAAGGGASTAANISAGTFGANTGGGDFRFMGHVYQENGKVLLARNSSGADEGWMWPRWSDNIMYTNFGSGGWNIRNNSSTNVMFLTNGGNVGIGNNSPSTKLQVAGGTRIDGTNGRVYLGTGAVVGSRGLEIIEENATTFSIRHHDPSVAWQNIAINPYAGKVGIGTLTPNETLEVGGNIRVSASGTGAGNITAIGTITGGNIQAKYQDVAEWVPSSEHLTTATVVVLDATRSNQVVRSTQSYDTRVAGVVSEQPGISLGENGKGKVLVATTGRVLVQVDANRGPIHIGDLLVTSDVPGVAMKSEPVNLGGVQLHRPGTLIGKALEPLEKGSGKILVLLSLQ